MVFFLSFDCVTAASHTVVVPKATTRVLPLGVLFAIITLESLLDCFISSPGKIPPGAVCAFERKPSGSLLTGGEAKNLRALHEYPEFNSLPS